MAHIIRKNAGRKTKTISELFTDKIFEFTFVSIFADMTIVPKRNNCHLECAIANFSMNKNIKTKFSILVQKVGFSNQFSIWYVFYVCIKDRGCRFEIGILSLSNQTQQTFFDPDPTL